MGGAGSSQPTPACVPDSGNTTHSLYPVWGQGASEMVNSVKSAHPKNILHWGIFLSTHPWQPTNWCSKSLQWKWNSKYLWALAVCMFIHSILRPGLCCRVHGHLRPHLTCLMCHQQTAQLETESRKGSMGVTLLHWKIPAGFVEMLKKITTHKLQVFSEAEQLKPRGGFLRCLRAVVKWSA